MMLSLVIYTVQVASPSLPPLATLRTSPEGKLVVTVEDVNDPEQEAVSAARAVLQHFIGKQNAQAR